MFLCFYCLFCVLTTHAPKSAPSGFQRFVGLVFAIDIQWLCMSEHYIHAIYAVAACTKINVEDQHNGNHINHSSMCWSIIHL